MVVRVLDNSKYLERRAAQADAAEAQRDCLVAQNLRRWKAIDQAVLQLRTVSQLNVESTLDAEALGGLLESLALSLEEANRVRSTDEEANEIA
jgi:hypothetical protein